MANNLKQSTKDISNNAQLYKSFKQKEADIIQKSGVPLARAYYMLDHKVSID
jgi:hypothetical protein